MTYTYEAETASERWLILNDKEQNFPTEPMKVLSVEERKTTGGKAMPVMMLEGMESGEKFLIVAWKRDVKACIEQYGNNPLQWDSVKFAQKNGRYAIVPDGIHAVTENVIV